jgi:hypothetical protein
LNGKRKEREGSLGCVDSEGDVKNQDKVGWFTRKVQRSWSHACQEQIWRVWWFGAIFFNITYQTIDGRFPC